METPIKDLWKAYKNGDFISDKDLLIFYHFLTVTEENLNQLGLEFNLAWKEIFFAKETVEGFITSRMKRKRNFKEI